MIQNNLIEKNNRLSTSLKGKITSFCKGFMALVTALILCARSQGLYLSVSERRVHVVFSTAGFKGGGKPCRKTGETAALRRGIQKTSRT